MQAYGKTDIGKVRRTNEDSYLISPGGNIFLVADGMGGHAAGEVASKLCVETVFNYLKNCQPNSNWQEMLRQAIESANSAIWQAARLKSEYAGMGTTLTAAYLEGERVYWGHVGDSRLYLIHNGEMRQLTEDHSLVYELVKKGSLTIAEAQVHPNRNILTRAVGSNEEVQVDTGVAVLTGQDKLLLCSDGLTNMVPDEELLNIISSLSIASALPELVKRANDLGGDDNITAVLIGQES